uniref:Uncharacterized protein n=1 Tax=Rhizophora mucronata TaxID=61149 RepID=A0A2P2IJ69_RHIMU
MLNRCHQPFSARNYCTLILRPWDVSIVRHNPLPHCC